MSKTPVADAIRKALTQARPRKIRDIAEQAGMSYDRLSNIAYGKATIGDTEMDALRKALNLPKYWPGSPPHLDGANAGEIVSLSGTPLVRIPVVGNASAGGGVWNVDNDFMTVRVPASIGYIDTVGFIVEGDSMMPMLEEFDTAIFRKAGRKLNGYIYLLKVPDDGYFVKLVRYDRGSWYLVSLNEHYPPQKMPEGTEFLGMLIAFYRVRGTREKWEVDAEGMRPDVYPPL